MASCANTSGRTRAILVAVALALGAGGCAEPIRIVSVPSSPARAALGEKGTGTNHFLVMQGGEPRPIVGYAQEHVATLAQSGEGTLGDRVFRENEHSMLEGCRWVAKGRVCNLVVLPDGTYLGGGVTWLVPDGAPATPRSSGWLARGIFVRPAATTGLTGTRQQNAVNSLAPVLMGQIYHCRFADSGPTCLPLSVTTPTTGYTVFGTFSLKDGDKRREVIWIGIFGEMAAGVDGGASAMGVSQVQRCETTEDESEVTCKQATLR